MRIYVNLKDVGTEYCTEVISEISLTPGDYQFYVDILEGESLSSLIIDEGDTFEETNLLPYNIDIPKDEAYLYKDNIYLEGDVPEDMNYSKAIGGTLYDIYREGILIESDKFVPYD